MPKSLTSRRAKATLLLTSQAAKALSISSRTIQRLCDSGAIPCSYLPCSGHRRISVADLSVFASQSRMRLNADYLRQFL